MSQVPYFIVNPHSANGKTGKLWPEIKQLFEAKLGKIDFALTKGTAHATFLTGKALYDGHERIIAIGGDGTLNEVVNGFYAEDKKISPNAILGYLPSGTGEDFSQTLGIKGLSLAERVNRLLDGGRKTVDIGVATYRREDGSLITRRFINEASVGFTSIVAKKVNESSKFLGSYPSYVLGILRSLMKLEHSRVKVVVDGREYFNGDTFMVNVSNGKYFGGSLKIAPQAEIDDGWLEIVVVERMGRLEIIGNMANVYKGTHLDNPKIRHTRGKEIVITSSENVYVEMDGEPVGLVGAKFRLLEKELNFIL
ncbi:MAG: diacylglycerol kinase family lipid kinase [Candidatus Margulisbacteria bacterium]|nr:diacylglycerol kinase family lipid kinase [Candidatus Margulisiibacteriota bacterium]